MNLVSPSVKVVSVDDNRERAWKLSRPYSTEPFENVKSWDMSCQDLCTITTEFVASAAFRELLTVIRPSSCWSQSSRNRFIEDIPFLDYTFKGQNKEIIKPLYLKAVEETKLSHQDKGRLHLPLAHSSPFTYSCNLRTCMCLIKAFKLLSEDIYYKYYGLPWLAELNISEDDFNKLSYKSLHYSYIRQLEDSKWTEGTTSFAGLTILNASIALALRAQLVRQGSARVYDEVWELVDNTLLLENMCLLDKIKCTIILSDTAYKIMCKKRSCLIAQLELWQSFLQPFWETEGINALPCLGKKELCICAAEAQDCMNGKASTLSCAIYDGKKESLDKRAAYMGEDSFIIKNLREWLEPNLE